MTKKDVFGCLVLLLVVLLGVLFCGGCVTTTIERYLATVRSQGEEGESGPTERVVEKRTTFFSPIVPVVYGEPVYVEDGYYRPPVVVREYRPDYSDRVYYGHRHPRRVNTVYIGHRPHRHCR